MVGADGRLCPNAPEMLPSVRVVWRGQVVHARLTATEPDGATLALRTVLGRVPSTGRPDGTGALPRQAAALLGKLLETLQGLVQVQQHRAHLGVFQQHAHAPGLELPAQLVHAAVDVLHQRVDVRHQGGQGWAGGARQDGLRRQGLPALRRRRSQRTGRGGPSTEEQL